MNNTKNAVCDLKQKVYDLKSDWNIKTYENDRQDILEIFDLIISLFEYINEE